MLPYSCHNSSQFECRSAVSNRYPARVAFYGEGNIPDRMEFVQPAFRASGTRRGRAAGTTVFSFYFSRKSRPVFFISGFRPVDPDHSSLFATCGRITPILVKAKRKRDNTEIPFFRISDSPDRFVPFLQQRFVMSERKDARYACRRVIFKNFSDRSRRTLSRSVFISSFKCLNSASPTAATVLSFALCAPPSGSTMISSIIPSDFKSAAVKCKASAAFCACPPSRHKIDAHPSGEMTE